MLSYLTTLFDKYRSLRLAFLQWTGSEGVMSDSMSDSTTAKNLTILIGGLVLLTFGIAGLVALIVY